MFLTYYICDVYFIRMEVSPILLGCMIPYTLVMCMITAKYMQEGPILIMPFRKEVLFLHSMLVCTSIAESSVERYLNLHNMVLRVDTVDAKTANVYVLCINYSHDAKAFSIICRSTSVCQWLWLS